MNNMSVGYRALAFKAGKEARLISRNRTNFDNDYPQLIEDREIVDRQIRDHGRRM